MSPPWRYRDKVRPEWIDYNGHMNVAYYVLVFDRATDAVLDGCGLGGDYVRRENRSVFAVEMHVNYLREVTEGDPLDVESLILEANTKRIRLFHTMRHATEDWIAATNEVMLLHVDLDARRSIPMPDAIRTRLETVAAAHAVKPRPEQAGRSIGMPVPRAETFSSR